MRDLTLAEINNVSGAGFGSAMLYIIAGTAFDVLSAAQTHEYIPVGSIIGGVMGLVSICCSSQEEGIFS